MKSILPITEQKREELLAVMHSYIDDIYSQKADCVENFKMTDDKEVLLDAIFANSRFKEMVSCIQAIISYLQYGHFHMIGIYAKDLELLWAETRNEFSDYLPEIEFIKDTLIPSTYIKDLLKKRKFNVSLEDIISDRKQRFDFIRSISEDLVICNGLLAKEEDMTGIKEKEERLEDLQVILKYVASIRDDI